MHIKITKQKEEKNTLGHGQDFKDSAFHNRLLNHVMWLIYFCSSISMLKFI